MMHAEIGAVGAELLGRDRKLDRLQQRVCAERTCDCGDGVQCPKERKPIFFMGIRWGSARWGNAVAAKALSSAKLAFEQVAVAKGRKR